MAENRIEYRFVLAGQTPDSISQARLAEYLADLARLYGEARAVHFVKVEESSLAIISAVEADADQDVSERLGTAESTRAPDDVRQAYHSLRRRIVEDGGPAYIARESARVLKFPTEQALDEPLVYGPFLQQGHLDGQVILIGGKSDPGSVKIQTAKGDVLLCKARRDVAKQLRAYLYEGPVRVTGRGKWIRDASGRWDLDHFDIDTVSPLDDESLSATIARLRAIDAPWKDRPDPLTEIAAIRQDD